MMTRSQTNPQFNPHPPARATRKRRAAIALMLLTLLPAASAQESAARVGQESVFKIHVTLQRHSDTLPWQADSPTQGSGTGFLIAKRRILTNAHLVADARFIQIQRSGDARRYDAKVAFIAHDCDLATLDVDDPAFFEGTRALRLARQLPQLNDQVMVLGYPMGGERLSVTRGVVSRLDFAPYAHSAVDSHLVLQVDAAINPGNSGGPVMQAGRVAGLAFQGIAWADNIGYAIPLPVLNHFLDDIDDGHYHGYPELGVAFLNLRNPALRRELKVPDNASGVAVIHVDPFGAASNLILPGDVLTSIDGYPIDDAGNSILDGHAFLFAEWIERKQWGDNVRFGLLRAGKAMELTVPLTNPADPFAYRHTYDERPEYLIEGGLVFSPLSRELLNGVNRQTATRAVRTLFYLFAYAKADGLHQNRSAFIVFTRRLPHTVNSFMDGYLYGVVDRVNDIPIGDMRDLAKALASRDSGYHAITFIGNEVPLILDAAAARAANRELLASYGIPQPAHIREKP